MAQKKGQTGNPHGRPRGRPNKVTADLRQWVSALIDGNRTQLEKDLKALEPKDRWMVIERLMNYTLPKMQSVDANVDLTRLSDEQITIVIDNLLKSIENENQN